jgi:hypothetical protein
VQCSKVPLDAVHSDFKAIYWGDKKDAGCLGERANRSCLDFGFVELRGIESVQF